MKQHIKILLASFIVIGLIGFFIGCEKDSATKKDLHLHGFTEIISNYNSTMLPDQWTRIEEGSVKFRINGNMISADCDLATNDNWISYYLQINDPKMDLPKGNFSKAEILFLGKVVIINSLIEDRALIFSLNSYDDSALNLESEITKFKGYGLGSNIGIKGFHPRVQPKCLCMNDEHQAGDCESGGLHSSSCGIVTSGGSCNVTCDPGTWSCCDEQGTIHN